LAAIFDRVFPDLSPMLVKELEQQFHGLARWKKQQNIDSRIRNARFIGELTKFRVAPPIVALRSLRRCLDDFNGYNVDIACCLLESCGRFLHRTKHTSARLTQLMDTMMRIRKARHFDERSVELMKSAFYMVQPPQQKEKRNVKILSPIEAYLKELLLVRLDKSNVSFVSKQILRFSWGDSCIDYGAVVVKYMLKTCRKGRYNSISAVASLVSNLKKPKPELLARLIDEVLEELQYIMEHPNIRDQQRALVYAKLLGELHSQTLVSSQAIFDQLYNFVNFDHEIPESLREASNQSIDNSATISSDLKSPLGISGAIVEDEEMDEDDAEDA
jgi:regulator of nonsense transcripts 2